MKVCVVGCGASGLVSVKSCLELGLDVTAYEQDESVGKYLVNDSVPIINDPATHHLLVNPTIIFINNIL